MKHLLSLRWQRIIGILYLMYEGDKGRKRTILNTLIHAFNWVSSVYRIVHILTPLSTVVLVKNVKFSGHPHGLQKLAKCHEYRFGMRKIARAIKNIYFSNLNYSHPYSMLQPALPRPFSMLPAALKFFLKSVQS